MSELKESMCKLAKTFCDQFTVESCVESCFRDNLLLLLDKFVPSKLKRTNNHQPWINRHIKQLRQWKQASYNRAKATRSSSDWSCYKELKKTMQRKCQRAFRKYMFSTIYDLYQNGRKKQLF